jgi:hypothetical protein
MVESISVADDFSPLRGSRGNWGAAQVGGDDGDGFWYLVVSFQLPDFGNSGDFGNLDRVNGLAHP